jgi:hypothetical protein
MDTVCYLVDEDREYITNNSDDGYSRSFRSAEGEYYEND